MVIYVTDLSQITVEDSSYIIGRSLNLNDSVLVLPYNSVLCFVQNGIILNGTIIGNHSRIQVEDNVTLPIFDNVVLTYNYSNTALSGWLGECLDIWFEYNTGIPSSGHQHFNIVKSVCMFEICSFSERTYYLTKWEAIYLRATGCIINGNGATLILPSYKGTTNNDGWNGLDQYVNRFLFYKDAPNLFGPEYASGHKAGSLSVSNLTICDNSDHINIPGYGDNVNRFKFYFIFFGSGNRVSFNNVNYDGCGCLWSDYNNRTHIDELYIENCVIQNTQFAFELGSLFRSELIQYNPEGGQCERVVIRNSKFYSYAENPLVGPLSFGNSGEGRRSSIIHDLLIDGCVFESEKEKNLEIMGCESITIRQNTFLSVQCSSEASLDCYGHSESKSLQILDNYFGISDNLAEGEMGGLCIQCYGDVFIKGNTFLFDYSSSLNSHGSIYIHGFGPNKAVIQKNHFYFKNVNTPNSVIFKSSLFYEDILVDLKDNEYFFLDSSTQGLNVNMGGRGPHYHFEVEDNPFFSNPEGGDFSSWQDTPVNKRDSRGALVNGESISLSETMTASSIEFDFYALVDNSFLSANTLPLLEFSANTESNDHSDVSIGFKNGLLCIRIGTGNPFSSGVGIPFSHPLLAFDTSGQTQAGYFRLVFWNCFGNSTRALLFLNDWFIDSIDLGVNILDRAWVPGPGDTPPEVISSITLHGSSFFGITRYRVRKHGQVIPFPCVVPQYFPYLNAF